MKKIFYLFLLFLLLLGVVLGGSYHPDLPLETLRERYTYPDSRFLTVNGLEVHYRTTGTGPVLLLLHGTGASLHTWERWTDLLSTGFRVVSLDLPAFGLTGPHPERDYSLPAYVDLLDAFVRELGLDSFYLAGNSLGGLIAWQYAASHPEKVDRLILLDPAGFPRETEEPLAFRLTRNPLTARLLLTITPRSLFVRSLREVYAEDSKVTDELVDRYFELFRRPGNRQAFVDRAQQSMVSDTMLLTSIRVPVLIQWGEEDAWIPVDHARRFSALLPNDTLIFYPQTGHVPMEESPEQTARDARFFLQHFNH